MELVDDLAGVRPRSPVHQQRRRLPQRPCAGWIAAQILDHARADQLDRHGDLLDLVFAQELPHHAAGEHAILAQRAPDLGEMIDRPYLRLCAATRGLAAPIGGGPLLDVAARPTVGERAHEGEGERTDEQAQDAERDGHDPGDSMRHVVAGRRGRWGGGDGVRLRRRLLALLLRRGLRRRIAEGRHLALLWLWPRGRKGDHALGDLDRHVEHLELALEEVLEVLAKLRGELGIERHRHLDPLRHELRAGRQLLEPGRGAGRQRRRAIDPHVDVLELGLAGRHLLEDRPDAPLDLVAHVGLQQLRVVAERRSALRARGTRRQQDHEHHGGRPHPDSHIIDDALHETTPS